MNSCKTPLIRELLLEELVSFYLQTYLPPCEPGGLEKGDIVSASLCLLDAILGTTEYLECWNKQVLVNDKFKYSRLSIADT